MSMGVVKKRLENMESYMIVLGAGADIFEELRAVFENSGWEEAFIVNAIGSVKKGVVRYPKTMDLPPEVATKEYEGSFELVSMVGIVRKEKNGTNLHIHASFVDEGDRFYGGALGKGSTVYKKLEIFLMVRPGDRK